MYKIIRHCYLGILIVTLLPAYFRDLETYPSLSAWWDEAWTMMVAKNLVEVGHYGQVRDGLPASPGLSASYPVVLPVAAGFKLLGVGTWQGRLPIALMALGMLLCLYLVGHGLAGERMGWAAVGVALLMSPHPLANPIIMGRQVMAEVPMLFYLLAGYVCFLKTYKCWGWMAGAVLLWVLASQTKAQMMPFLSLALAVPLGWALLERSRGVAARFGAALAGIWLGGVGISWAWGWLIQGQTIPNPPLEGLVRSLALTLEPTARRSAILALLLFGLPTAIGLVYLGVKLLRGRNEGSQTAFLRLVWASIFVFCGSWLTWYVSLSIGWVRYVMPATLVGSLAVARLIADLTRQFDLRYTVTQVAETLLHLRFFTRQSGAWWVFVVATLMTAMTVMFSYLPIFSLPDRTLEETIAYLHTNTPAEARIESYESEVLFLLARRTVYPPDQVSADILQLHGRDAAALGYDPLLADPDYLVVGRFARGIGLYTAALENGQFSLMTRIGDYEIFQRLR